MSKKHFAILGTLYLLVGCKDHSAAKQASKVAELTFEERTITDDGVSITIALPKTWQTKANSFGVVMPGDFHPPTADEFDMN